MFAYFLGLPVAQVPGVDLEKSVLANGFCPLPAGCLTDWLDTILLLLSGCSLSDRYEYLGFSGGQISLHLIDVFRNLNFAASSFGPFMNAIMHQEV
jgi:hypothetical protein